MIVKGYHLVNPPQFFKRVLLASALLCLLVQARAVNYTSNVALGNWNVATSWTPNGIPTAGDNVTIITGDVISVTAAASCATLNVTGTLNWTAAVALTVSGSVTLNNGGLINGASAGTLTDNGTFTVGAGASGIGRANMTVAGTSTYNGVVTYSNVTGVITHTGAVTFNAGSGITFTVVRLVTFNGGLIVAGNAATSGTATGTLNINGTLAVNAAATFGVAQTTLAVTGATTIANTGDIVFNDANGAKTFAAVTINAGGKWDCSGFDIFFLMKGNLTNNGTFLASATLNNNEYKFSTVSSINGILTIPNLNCVSVITNNAILTIPDSLYGTGSYIQANGSILYYNSPKVINVTTFTPSANSNLVEYNYAGNQTVKGSAAIKYYNLNCSNSGNKLMGNTINVLNNLTIQGTATFDADVANNRSLFVAGNWTDSSTAVTPFIAENGLVTFNGTVGVQAITTVRGAGESFWDITFNNTSPSSPNITTNKNFNIGDNTLFTAATLDLQGHSYLITGNAGNTTDKFLAGLIMSSVAGSTFNVTDPSRTKIIYFSGTQIGTAANSITITTSAGRTQFTNFTEYGTANFTKTYPTDDVFGGGNYYHGPVTFTAAVTSSRWRMGDNNAVPDTFWNATFNAFADSGSNNNFIVGANSLGNAFYGTTTMTSTTPGGFFVCRQNGNGNASCRFYGPVIANITLTGIMTFADAAAGNVGHVEFDSTITLNSTATSTGYYHFCNNNAFGSITLSPGGQFLAGAITGKTNVYLCNVTQLGNKVQTVNTQGSTGALYCGGTTALPAFECTFNGPCNFSADTAGYFVGCKFNGATNISVNHANANGYIISDTFNAACTAIVGDIRFEKNIFNGNTTLEHTSAFTSSSNGGNTFNGTTIIQNAGTGILRQGGYAGLGDAFNGDVTFWQSGAGAIISPAYTDVSTFAGLISTAGSVGAPIVFAGNGGTMEIVGNGVQQFANGGSLIYPTVVNLTMNTVAANNVMQMNFPLVVTGTLNFTQGLINMNSYTLTLGTAVATPGTLLHTNGWVYNGTFTRWVKTTAIAIPANTGLMPIGTDPLGSNVYRPFWIGSSANLTAGGTVTVIHNPTMQWFNPVSYFDASWGNAVQGVSYAAWQLSTGNGFALNGASGQIRFGGGGFGIFVLSDLNASLAFNTVGTFGAATSFNVPLEVNRTALTQANFVNTWHIGTDDIDESPLPVTLLSFNAQATAQNTVNVAWVTASQVDNKWFTVERSKDGVIFDSIGILAGAGTTSETLTYGFLDESPYTGTSYYRLKQTNLDGTSSYSHIAAVNISLSAKLTVYPNPANASSVYTYNATEAGNADIRMITADGKVINTGTVNMQQGANTLPLNAGSLAGGTYSLQVILNGQANETKFIVR